MAGSGLEYAADVRVNFATEEICIQVIADTKLAVDRTIVETWKRLSDSADRDMGVFLVPPARKGEAFPGAGVFGPRSGSACARSARALADQVLQG